MSVPGRNYSSEPLPREHVPPRQSEALSYRPCLRLEFGYKCAYCIAHEAEVARGASHGLFEVEHFKPEHRFGNLRTVYGNLLWACARCNRTKGKRWPSAAAESRGERFVNPCEEALGEHLEIVDDDVVGKSPAGNYMIDELNLNSLEQQTRRIERRKAFDLWSALQSAIQARPIPALERAELEAEATRIMDLILGEHKPADAVQSCKCGPAK